MNTSSLQILTFPFDVFHIDSPAHPEGHALWRSYLSGMSFSMLNQLLSMSLIIMGLSYKGKLDALVTC